MNANATDLCYTPATKLISLIRSKKLSPVELTKAVLERVEKLNPKINAFCLVTADAAMKAAREAEQAVMKRKKLGPIHGIPFSIKDLAFTKGVRTMGGSHIFASRVPDQDAPFVRRLKEAGGILVGKTTTPEFGWKALSGCPLTGDTHNPWNLAMNTGGSSSGAGAAAAAGLGPLHHGSDGAGSIRVPSSFCGIFGHKPSYGRVPQWPVSNNDYTTHNGPMTRTVGDAALMLSIMAGQDGSGLRRVHRGRPAPEPRGLHRHARQEDDALGFGPPALREARPPPDAVRFRRRLPAGPSQPRALAPARVGLARLGVLLL